MQSTEAFTRRDPGVERPAADQVIAVFGGGQFAIASARMLGAERVIAIDRFPYRLKLAMHKAGATDVINYEEQNVQEVLRDLTAGRGPDACIDCVGLEAHGTGLQYTRPTR